MDKNEAQKIANAAALATVTLLESKGVIRSPASAVEKTEEALRQYPVWKTMDDPAAKRMVDAIDECLAEFENEPYLDTVRLFYFAGMKNSACARTVCCDERTAQRNRRNIVKQFAARLYPGEYIQDLR